MKKRFERRFTYGERNVESLKTELGELKNLIWRLNERLEILENKAK
jgi:hypothetical protein